MHSAAKVVYVACFSLHATVSRRLSRLFAFPRSMLQWRRLHRALCSLLFLAVFRSFLLFLNLFRSIC